MSSTTLGHLFADDDLQEQICYVHCGYCATILLVSVPCSSLTEVVTVRCGHCTSLLSVNMMRASFLPLHLFPPFKQAEEPKTQVCLEQDKALDHHHHPIEKLGSETEIPSPVVSFSSSDEEEEEADQVINKPPEKRQRAPSAYNLFIGQEIQRLKAIYPTMTHKQAFSMAAKNWAHFPLNGQREGEGQGEKDATLL